MRTKGRRLAAKSSGAETPRIAPSTVGRYFFHDCPRFLAFKSRAGRGVPKPGRKDAVVEAFAKQGEAWEERIVGTLGSKAHVARGKGSVAERHHNAGDMISMLRKLRHGEHLFQPTLEPAPGALGLPSNVVQFNSCRPDLLRVEKRDGVRLFTVIDIKRSPQVEFPRFGGRLRG